MMESYLGIYTVREPNQENIEEGDWRKKVSTRIPSHYFNLHLEDIFKFEVDKSSLPK